MAGEAVTAKIAGPSNGVGVGRGRKKASDEQLARAYAELGNIWRVAERFRMCGQSVHERLVRLGLNKPVRTFSEADIARIRIEYDSYASTGRLKEFAAELGHTKANLARKAGEFGLTNKSRPKPYQVDVMSTNMKNWHRNNPHPRGMFGKVHSEETKRALSVTSTKYWLSLPDDQKATITIKGMKTKLANGTLVMPRLKASWKAGWREIGGAKSFYRSAWEANYARYLQWLKERGEIAKWEHEPETFWFEAIKRGTRSYLPDFRVTENSGAVSYHEVKGWMDDRSKTKIKRMAKYHPHVKLIVIDSKAYRKIAETMAQMLPGWETPAKKYGSTPKVTVTVTPL